MTERAKRFALLRLPPQQKAVYFLIPAWDKPDAEKESTEYLYEEHVCPTDLLSREGVELISVEGDLDPHGIFEWVRSIDRPEFLDRTYSSDEWREVLPELFNDGETAK